MSWSDILYPGNPQRREEVARLYQQLFDCMDLTFNGANELIQALNTHFNCKLELIKINMKGTIQENCNVFLSAIKSIQDILQTIDERLKRELEPDLYRKLHDFQETDTTKMQILSSWVLGVNELTGIALGLFIKVALSKVTTRTLSKMMEIVMKIGTSWLGSIILGAVLGVGINLVLGAILGAIERDQLETTIQELKALVDEFKPASQEYYKTIIKIICQLP